MISRILTALLVFGLVACSDDSPDAFIESVQQGQQELVKLEVTATETILDIGSERQLTATATNASGSTTDYTNLATWSSSNTSLVTVSSSGLVKAIANGTATITAAFGSLSDTLDIRASDANLVSIDISSTEANVDECQNIQMTATGNYDDGTQRNITDLANWSSSDTAVGEFDTQSGKDGSLRTFDSGVLGINATYKSISGSGNVTILDTLSSIAISPSTVSVETGKTQSFSASGNYSDNTTSDITDNTNWTTSGSTIDNTYPDKGTFTASTIETTAVTATCGQLTQTASVTVTTVKTISSLEISGGVSGYQREVGDDAIQLTAVLKYNDDSSATVTNDDNLTWSVSSGDSSVISVSNADGDEGEVTFTGAGSAVIEAKYDDDSTFYTDTITITITE